MLVAKEANVKKHNISLTEFLKSDPERLEKVKNFMDETGFNTIYKKYKNQLHLNCNSLYIKIRKIVEVDFNDFIAVIQLNLDPHIPQSIPSPCDTPPDQFQEQNAPVQYSNQFILYKIDRNNNKFYFSQN
ncbi:MAG: hypothetical protein LBN28_01785 [Desulfovibrio sp.]|nr:hypothetical protein [Desulfovibrio sp.]